MMYEWIKALHSIAVILGWLECCICRGFRWFEDGRVADRSKKEKHQGNGRTTIEHPESLQEIACVKQFDLVQGYSY